MAYGVLTVAGMAADTLNYAELARHSVEVAQPLTSSILNIASEHGFKLRADTPDLVRMGMAMFVSMPVTMSAFLAGAKLKQAASRAVENRMAEPGATKGPGLITGFAGRLRGIVSGVASANMPDDPKHRCETGHEPEPEAEAMR